MNTLVGRVDMNDEQIIEAMTTLLSTLAWRNHPVLERSDIRPHVVGDTGCWVDPDIEGDEHGHKDEYIGIGFFIKDAVDDDTGAPFMTGIKIHKPSFCANPQRYVMEAAMNMSRAIGAMENEMNDTSARKDSRRMKALLESGKIKWNERIH